MEEWFNNEEIWNSIDEKKRRELEPYREKVARLERSGYRVLRFNPGVVFISYSKLTSNTYDTNDCAQLNDNGWEAFDKALAEIEKLTVTYKYDNSAIAPQK